MPSKTSPTGTKKTGSPRPENKCVRTKKQLSPAQKLASQRTVEPKNVSDLNQYSCRSAYDKFYTKESVAIACLKLLDLGVYDFIVEPSAGNGSFFRNINSANKIGLDIKPESRSIIEQNWFNFEIDKSYRKVLIVGNPPFGRRNKLSIGFINHASSFDNVQTIAFILPNVFNKHTLQKHICPKFLLKYSVRLPPYSFEIDSKPFDLPCTFFIYDKTPGHDLRFSPDNYVDTKDFVFGTKTHYDFFILGASPKTVKDSRASNNRGYFIKVREGGDVERVKEKFRKCLWKGNSSVSGGAFWLTKPELIIQYRNQFEDEVAIHKMPLLQLEHQVEIVKRAS